MINQLKIMTSIVIGVLAYTVSFVQAKTITSTIKDPSNRTMQGVNVIVKKN